MKSHPLLAGTALALLMCAPAGAAISVLGNSIANNCYQAAEFDADANTGIETCTYALTNETLSARDRAATYVNRGILRSRAGDADGALADYNAGLSLDSGLSEGYVDRGATYIAMRRYDEALQDINRGIQMGARRPHIAYYDRAIVDEAMGNIRGAYEDYKKAVELQPDFTLATEQLSRFKVVRHTGGGGA